MANRPIPPPIDQSTYEALIDYFRASAPAVNYAGAGRQCSVSRATARRAFEKGWPKLQRPPISALLEEDRVQARAQIEVSQRARTARLSKEAEDARNQAVEAMKQEGQQVTLGRAAVLQGLEEAVKLGQTARGLAGALAEHVEVERQKLLAWTAHEKDVLAGHSPAPPPCVRPTMTVLQAISYLKQVADLQGKLIISSRIIMEQERLHVGAPTKIIGIADAREITLEEAESRVALATRATKRMREAGGPTVVPEVVDVPVIGEPVEPGRP